MDEHINQLKYIFDVTYLTLIVKMDGTHLIGMFTKKYIDSHFKQYNDNYYTIDDALIHFSGSISLFLKSIYKIPKKEPLKLEIKEKDIFLSKYKNQFNQKASYCANYFDKYNSNYIIGDCAFIFESDSFYTGKKLQDLITLICKN